MAYLLAEQAGSALAAVIKIENLEAGLAARTVVGQAQGILMHKFGLGPARAWNTLVRISKDNNVKVRDMADQIIRTGQLPDLPA